MPRAVPALLLTTLLTLPSTALAFPSAGERATLAAMVQPIITEARFADGAVQRNRGSGFVIGDRFYTAYHNLQAGAGTIVEQRIVLGGQLVVPMAVDVAHDLAVFALPAILCRSWCNAQDLVDDGFDVDSVMWLDSAAKAPRWERARVRNLAFKNVPRPGREPGCDADLVVEIDAAFVPGDSGGPVFDSASGRVVGLIQGSFEDPAGTTTGYFKPAACVRARLSGNRTGRQSP